MAKRDRREECHCKRRFPTFAIILLAIGLIWLLNDLKLITIDIPWIPVIIIIIALVMIINRVLKYDWEDLTLKI